MSEFTPTKGCHIRNGRIIGEPQYESYITTSVTIPSGSTTKVISDASITANSLIDIYYSNSSVSAVKDAEPSYSQASGSLTITFANALTSAVTIDAIRVTNLA